MNYDFSSNDLEQKLTDETVAVFNAIKRTFHIPHSSNLMGGESGWSFGAHAIQEHRLFVNYKRDRAVLMLKLKSLISNKEVDLPREMFSTKPEQDGIDKGEKLALAIADRFSTMWGVDLRSFTVGVDRCHMGGSNFNPPTITIDLSDLAVSKDKQTVIRESLKLTDLQRIGYPNREYAL